MENEKSININLGDTRFEMTRDNSRLYTFVGRAALYNHIYIVRDDLGKTQEGNDRITYLFEDLLKRGNPEVYSRLEQAMVQYAFPMHLNETTPATVDVESYIKAASMDLADTFPEDWK